MKRLLLTAIICGLFTTAFAQSATDSVRTKSDTTKTKKKTFTIKVDVGGDADLHIRDTTKVKVVKNTRKFNFGITYARFDLGFSRLIDNGSFTLSPQNQFLDYRGSKTAYVGFDLVQMSYRFNPYFKLYLAGGIDWTLIRLRQNITIQENASTLTYTTDNVNYDKNRFSASYLRIPLAFDFRTKDNKKGNKFRFTIGPEVGFLLNGKVKQVSDEMGKKKFNNNYHFSQFRYGAYARAGYKSTGLFIKYYQNGMFENSPNQNGLKSLNFGLTFGL